MATSLVEGGRAVGGEDLLAGGLGDAVREGELEVLGEELLDVWAADVLGLLNLDDLEDLWKAEKRMLDNATMARMWRVHQMHWRRRNRGKDIQDE